MFIENEKLRNIFIGIMLFGLIIFILGIVMSFKVIYWDVRSKESTSAVITDIGQGYTTFNYKVNGRTYIKKASVNSSTYYVGKKIKVYYKPSRPQKVSIASLRYLILMMPGIGIIFLGISGMGLLYYFFKYIRPKM